MDNQSKLIKQGAEDLMGELIHTCKQERDDSQREMVGVNMAVHLLAMVLFASMKTHAMTKEEVMADIVPSLGKAIDLYQFKTDALCAQMGMNFSDITKHPKFRTGGG